MTEQKRRFSKCPETCAGGGDCICAAGHKASHICRRRDCICHTPEGYGLELSERGYVRRVDQFAGVGLLQVSV